MLHYEGHLTAKDMTRAQELFLQAARGGNANAMVNLGVIAYNGETGTRDRAEANHWWQLAAERGSADAARFLAATSNKLSAEELAKSSAQSAAWKASLAQARLATLPSIALRN